ncbi:hypothetical protein ACFQ3Z_03220 [Streptomyces nogalater]
MDPHHCWKSCRLQPKARSPYAKLSSMQRRVALFCPSKWKTSARACAGVDTDSAAIAAVAATTAHRRTAGICMIPPEG